MLCTGLFRCIHSDQCHHIVLMQWKSSSTQRIKKAMPLISAEKYTTVVCIFSIRRNDLACNQIQRIADTEFSDTHVEIIDPFKHAFAHHRYFKYCSWLFEQSHTHFLFILEQEILYFEYLNVMALSLSLPLIPIKMKQPCSFVCNRCRARMCDGKSTSPTAW